MGSIISALLPLLQKYWKQSAIIGAIVGAGFLGRITAPKPSPSMQMLKADDYEGTSHNDVRIEQVAGPVVIKTHTVVKTIAAPGQACGTETTSDTEETHGSVVTNTNNNSTNVNSDHVTTTLKVNAESTKHRWALGLGLDDPLGLRKTQILVEFRIFDDLWAYGSVIPGKSMETAVGLKLEVF